MSFPLLQDVMATIAAALALTWVVRHVIRGAPPASNPSCNGCPLLPPLLEHRREIVANIEPLD